MQTGGTVFGRFGALHHIAAVGAMPLDLFLLFENFAVGDILNQFAVPALMELFDLGNLLKGSGHLRVAFLFGNTGKILVNFLIVNYLFG